MPGARTRCCARAGPVWWIEDDLGWSNGVRRLPGWPNPRCRCMHESTQTVSCLRAIAARREAEWLQAEGLDITRDSQGVSRGPRLFKTAPWRWVIGWARSCRECVWIAEGWDVHVRCPRRETAPHEIGPSSTHPLHKDMPREHELTQEALRDMLRAQRVAAKVQHVVLRWSCRSPFTRAHSLTADAPTRYTPAI